jgi:hypothetical protein
MSACLTKILSELVARLNTVVSQSQYDMTLQHRIPLDVHKSVHRYTIMKVTNKMQLHRSIYYSWPALHVLGDVFAHHQEHLTVFIASGSIHPSCCKYSQVLLMMGKNITQNM